MCTNQRHIAHGITNLCLVGGYCKLGPCKHMGKSGSKYSPRALVPSTCSIMQTFTFWSAGMGKKKHLLSICQFIRGLGACTPWMSSTKKKLTPKQLGIQAMPLCCCPTQCFVLLVKSSFLMIIFHLDPTIYNEFRQVFASHWQIGPP